MTAGCSSCGAKPRRKRQRREREIPEVAAGVRRLIDALGRRVAQADPVDLRELVAIRDAAELAFVEAMRHQKDGTYVSEAQRKYRVRHGEPVGYSYAQIAAGLGVTRQAVAQWYQRAARRLDAATNSATGPTAVAS